jgi:hypothetical protein
MGAAYFCYGASCNYYLSELRLVPLTRPADNVRMPSLLLIAASRGLGLAMAEQFLKKDWNVVGSVRAASPPVRPTRRVRWY